MKINTNVGYSRINDFYDQYKYKNKTNKIMNQIADFIMVLWLAFCLTGSLILMGTEYYISGTAIFIFILAIGLENYYNKKLMINAIAYYRKENKITNKDLYSLYPKENRKMNYPKKVLK
jgi:hypothetical protein